MEDTLLHCAICLDYAEVAVETNCCGHIFCTGCVSAVNVCPCCRHQKLTHRPSMLARRAIGAMPAQCPLLCGSTLTRMDVESHIQVCENRQYTCPLTSCGYIAKKNDIATHIIQQHLDLFIKNMHYVFNPPSPPFLRSDPIASTRNDAGAQARLGESGKYYCGGRGCDTGYCCDGRCGPTNGCNCAPCQRLDIKSRQLPPGWLVNRAGAPARPGTTGMLYCGRRVLGGVAASDGYCGPTDGPQCNPCRVLQQQSRPGYMYGAIGGATNTHNTTI